MAMCEWTLADIKNRASNKAFAKVTILTLDIETYEEDLRTGNIGGVTYEEFEQVVKGYETELQVWNYITELIEKSKSSKELPPESEETLVGAENNTLIFPKLKSISKFPSASLTSKPFDLSSRTELS